MRGGVRGVLGTGGTGGIGRATRVVPGGLWRPMQKKRGAPGSYLRCSFAPFAPEKFVVATSS